jgi:hypothetical protein
MRSSLALASLTSLLLLPSIANAQPPDTTVGLQQRVAEQVAKDGFSLSHRRLVLQVDPGPRFRLTSMDADVEMDFTLDPAPPADLMVASGVAAVEYALVHTPALSPTARRRTLPLDVELTLRVPEALAADGIFLSAHGEQLYVEVDGRHVSMWLEDDDGEEDAFDELDVSGDRDAAVAEATARVAAMVLEISSSQCEVTHAHFSDLLRPTS